MNCSSLYSSSRKMHARARSSAYRNSRKGVLVPQQVTVEDPVTGSLNASLAQWLLGTGRLRAPYVASQGTVLGREGRAHISVDDHSQIWVAGGTVTCVDGHIDM